MQCKCIKNSYKRKNGGKFRINKRDLLIILLLLLIFVVGIIANIKYKYQPLKIAFSDVLLVFKFFLVYFLWKICCLVYLLISSTSESAFVHPMAITLAFVIGAYSKNRLIS